MASFPDIQDTFYYYSIFYRLLPTIFRPFYPKNVSAPSILPNRFAYCSV